MKKWGKLIALAVVLVALVAAYFFLLKGGKPAGSTGAQASASASATPNTDIVKIFDYKKDDIKKIVFKRDTGDIVLTQTNGVVESQTQNADGTTSTTTQNALIWVTDGFKMDSTIGDNVAYAAENVSTSRLIDPDPKDLSVYGLDKPLVTALYNADGKEETIEIGSKTLTGDNYYVRKGGDKAVYTMMSYAAENFTVGKLDMISKQIYTKDGLIDNNMTSLTFYKEGTKMFDTHVVDPAQPGAWQLTYPLEREADYPDLDKFLGGLAGLGMQISKIADLNPSDLKIYGLDKPKYEFVYTLDGKNYDLKVGSLKDSAYYCMIGDDNLVFTLDQSNLSFADMPVIDVIDLLIYVPSIFNTNKLVIEVDGRTDVMEMEVSQPRSDKDTYTFNGQKVEGDNNQALFRRYYQAAIALMGDKIDLQAKPQGKPFVRLTYTSKTGFVNERDSTVELIPTPDGYGYYAMFNGQYTGLVMGKRQLDNEDMGLRTSYKNLMDALNAAK